MNIYTDIHMSLLCASNGLKLCVLCVICIPIADSQIPTASTVVLSGHVSSRTISFDK